MQPEWYVHTYFRQGQGLDRFPDKFYVGTFGRRSRYDNTADKEGIHLHLSRQDGEKLNVGFHVQNARRSPKINRPSPREASIQLQRKKRS